MSSKKINELDNKKPLDDEELPNDRDPIEIKIKAAKRALVLVKKMQDMLDNPASYKRD